jgi:hypothetical protein
MGTVEQTLSPIPMAVVVVEITVEPKYVKSVTIVRDDFVLRDIGNAERSTPFAPSQIAGRATLVVKRAGDSDEVGASSGKKAPHKPTLSGVFGYTILRSTAPTIWCMDKAPGPAASWT